MREHETGVTIGFDSQVSMGWQAEDLEQPKVFVNRGIVYGVAGALVDSNTLKYADLPSVAEVDWDVDRWVATRLLPAIRGALQAAGVLEVNNGKIKSGCSILAVVKGRVYNIGHDTAFSRNTKGIYAIGSGSDYALGAMAADATIRQALDIAAAHDMGTGGRLTVTQANELLAA
jgi:ATP-dependent protease HslVU (ClpYQ) peptidase subunit